MARYTPNNHLQTAELSNLKAELSNLKAEAIAHDTPPMRLQELAIINLELRQLVATNPQTPSLFLKELAKSTDITTRKNVCGNPNTPEETLYELGAEFPETLLDNPLFSLLELENDYRNKNIPVATMVALIKTDRAPIGFLDYAVDLINNNHNSYRYNNYNTPAYNTHQNIRQVSNNICLHLVQQNYTPRSILGKLTKFSPTISELVLLHANFSGEMTEWDDISTQAIKAIKVIKLKQDDDPFYDVSLIKQNNLRDDYHWLNLAKIGAIPAFVIDFLPPQLGAYETLASCQQTSPLVLAKLAQNQHSKIRLLVAQNPQTSRETLNILATDSDREIAEEASYALYYKNYPVSTAEAGNNQIAVDRQTLQELIKVVKFGTWEERLLVAENPLTPLPILEYLINTDREPLVRIAIAHHPQLNESLMLKLLNHNQINNVTDKTDQDVSILGEIVADSPNIFVDQELAKNPRTPAYILAKLLGLTELIKNTVPDHIGVREAVARNPNANAEILKYLCQDKVASVVEIAFPRYLSLYPDQLAELPFFPIYNLAKEPKSELFYNLFILLLHPQVPIKILIDNCQHDHWFIRYAVASNPNTPQSILAQLAQSPNRIVRYGALQTMKSAG